MNQKNKLQQLLDLESQRFTTTTITPGFIIRIAATQRANIERTLTNRELSKLETEYSVRFKAIFQKIVLEYMDKEYLLHEAHAKYGKSIHTLIKSMVTRVYFLGMEYVGRAIGKPYLITFEPQDEQQIKLQTKEAEDMFWRLITKYLQVKKNRKLLKPRLERLRAISRIRIAAEEEDENVLLSILTNVNLILNTIAISVLALATTEKTRQIEQLKYQSLDARNGNPLNQEQKHTKIVFVCNNDERTCPICLPLQNKSWNIDDPNIIIPRIHTHHRCRCRLLLKIDDKIISK